MTKNVIRQDICRHIKRTKTFEDELEYKDKLFHHGNGFS